MILNMCSLTGLAAFPDNSFDSIVTDPPYELGFMGKSWDASGIAYNVELWKQCLRVLKPGGHLLSFGGSRTYHRMACAIEDAGFEIRDQIQWIYGSGFPKSLDVSKAIDKAAGAEREVIGVKMRPDGKSVLDARPNGFKGSAEGWDRPWKNDPEAIAKQGMKTAPATEAAQKWEGWGTALKPAHEPICVARKPLIGTVAQNVLAHGTGAINVDGCRVGDEGGCKHAEGTGGYDAGTVNALGGHLNSAKSPAVDGLGRWPANLIHDGNVYFPNASGQQAATTGNEPSAKTNNVHGDYEGRAASKPRVELDKSAARFFYCAKASKADREEGNIHPTVKPTELMRYLCRLVTPPNGVILDPFAGSGSTGKAAILEGFHFLGYEIDPDYARIAQARIDAARNKRT